MDSIHEKNAIKSRDTATLICGNRLGQSCVSNKTLFRKLNSIYLTKVFFINVSLSVGFCMISADYL